MQKFDQVFVAVRKALLTQLPSKLLYRIENEYFLLEIYFTRNSIKILEI
jgi:hypothetical protein